MGMAGSLDIPVRKRIRFFSPTSGGGTYSNGLLAWSELPHHIGHASSALSCIFLKRSASLDVSVARFARLLGDTPLISMCRFTSPSRHPPSPPAPFRHPSSA